MVSQASPCPRNTCITCPKDKENCHWKGITGSTPVGLGRKVVLQHMNVIWASWQSGTTCCSSSPESCCSGLSFCHHKISAITPFWSFLPTSECEVGKSMLANKPIYHPLSLHMFCQRWDTCDPLEAEFLFCNCFFSNCLKIIHLMSYHLLFSWPTAYHSTGSGKFSFRFQISGSDWLFHSVYEALFWSCLCQCSSGIQLLK